MIMGNNNVNLSITGSVELGNETAENAQTEGFSIKQRLSSWALWVSVLGLTGLILEALGVFERLGITGDARNTAITSLGAALSAFGIVNNPTDRERL